MRLSSAGGAPLARRPYTIFRTAGRERAARTRATPAAANMRDVSHPNGPSGELGPASPRLPRGEVAVSTLWQLDGALKAAA